MTGGDGVTPDTKDWTWVLDRPCSDCGFDATAVTATEVADHIRSDALAWDARLAAADAAVRRDPAVWSTLEYGCHIRDVHRIFEGRVRLMLNEHEPHFPNWDQDETALADDYGSQDPATVAVELRHAAEQVADTYDDVPADAWPRRGLRSNGSDFTIDNIARYHLHDIVHHAWDVDNS